MLQTFNTSFKTLDSHKLEVNTTPESENGDSSNSTNSEPNISASEDTIKQCGVCKETVKLDKWMDHIERKHEYIAWEEGHEPLVSTNNDKTPYQGIHNSQVIYLWRHNEPNKVHCVQTVIRYINLSNVSCSFTHRLNKV